MKFVVINDLLSALFDPIGRPTLLRCIMNLDYVQGCGLLLNSVQGVWFIIIITYSYKIDHIKVLILFYLPIIRGFQLEKFVYMPCKKESNLQSVQPFLTTPTKFLDAFRNSKITNY